MSITIPKHRRRKDYEEEDGVRYPLRVPTAEITGHPIAGEWEHGVWHAIEEGEHVSEGTWHMVLLTALTCAVCRAEAAEARVRDLQELLQRQRRQPAEDAAAP